jgi:hypothetical protein
MILVKLNNSNDASGGVTFIKGDSGSGGRSRDASIELNTPLQIGTYAFFV